MFLFLLTQISIAQSSTLTHTTSTDFSSGTFTGLGTSVGSAGDVRLGSGGAEILPGFSTTTVTPDTRDAVAVAAWNGRLYVSGGRATSSGVPQTTVYSAAINADGTVGSWTTESNSLPATLRNHAMVAWNGRLYVTGGANDVAGTSQNTVYSAPINSDGSVGSWTTELNVLPAVRRAHAMVAWNGRLYVTGGYDGTTVQTTVYSAPLNSDGSVGSWITEANSLPTARWTHAMVDWNGRLYVVGGSDGTDISSTVYSAPVNSNGTVGSWTTESNALPSALWMHVMVSWGGKLYVIGGSSNTAATPQANVYVASITASGSVGSWTTETYGLPAPRAFHGAAVWNGNVLLVGGDDASGAATNSVYHALINADGQIGGWTTESNSLPIAMDSIGMSIWNGRMYVAGGSNNGTSVSTVAYATINSNGSVGAWTTSSSLLPQAISSHTMAVWDGRLYISGGSVASGSTSSVVYASINPDGSVGSWVATSSIPIANTSHAMVAWNGRLYVAGGADAAASNDVYYASITANGSLGTWQSQINPLPATIASHAMAVWNSRLYIIGGNSSGATTAVYQASITANGSVGSWSATTPLSATRMNLSAIAWNGKLYVAGGNDATNAYTTVYSAVINNDGTIGSWTTESSYPLPSARSLHKMAIWNGKFYVVGGSTSTTPSQATVYSNGVTFFSSTGTYFGPRVDLGSVRNIDNISWTQSANPSGSSVSVYISTQVSASVGLSTWTQVTSGSTLNAVARYVQYRIDMAPGGTVGTPVRDQSPVIDDVSLVHTPDVSTPTLNSVSSVSTGSFSASFTDLSFGENDFVFSTGTASGPTNIGLSTATSAQSSTGTVQAATIRNLVPNTTYFIRVRAHATEGNTYGGYSNELSTVTLANPPSTTTVSFPVVGVASITVQWGANSNSVGTAYSAEYSRTSNFASIDTASTTLTTSATFFSLIPNTTYYARVRASNYGQTLTPYTGLGSTVTLANTPVPQNPILFNLTSSALSNQWYTAGNPTGTVYTAEITTDSAFGSISASSTTVLSTATFSSLIPNTTYFTRVKARNYMGVDTGYFTLSSSATYAQAPGSVASTFSAVGATSLAASWDASTNSVTTRYAAELSTNSNYSTTNFSSSTVLTTATFSGLTPGTTYYFRVQALGHNGTNTAYTNLGSTVTAAAVPIVADFTGVTISSLTANWGAGTNPAGTTYTADLATDGSFGSISATSVTVNTSAGFTGLAINATYYVRVKARSVQGIDSSYSSAMSTATLAVAPVTLTSTFTAVNITSMSVNWAQNGNPVGTSYIAELSSTSNYSNVDFSSNTVLTTATIAGLTPNTTYYFRVKARNYQQIDSAYVNLGSTVTLTNVPAAAAFTGVVISSLSASWGANSNPSATTYIAELSSASNYSNVDFSSSTVLTTATLSGLTPNTTYYFRVKARNYQQTDSAYNTLGATITLANMPSSAVSTYTAVFFSSMTVQWGANSNPTGTAYLAQLATSTNFANIASSSRTLNTSATLTGLTDFTIYYLRVQAINYGGVATAYLSLGSTTTAILGNPPGSAALSDVRITSITANWTAGNNQAGTTYNAEVAVDASFGSLAASSVTLNLSANFAGLIPNTTYYLRAQSVVNGSSSSYTSLGSTATLANVPAVSVFDSVATDTIRANWGANSNPIGSIYTTQIDDDSAFGSINAASSTVATSATFASLTPNTTYYARVKAKNYNDIDTTFVTLASTVTLANVPLNFTITQVFLTSVAFSWAGNGNSSGTIYRLGYWQRTGATTTVDASGLNYNLTGLEPAATYYFRLQAKNGSGVLTDFSSTLSTTTSVSTQASGTTGPDAPITLTFYPPPGEVTIQLPARTFDESVAITVQTPSACPATNPSNSYTRTNVCIDVALDKSLTPAKEATMTLSYRNSDVAGLDKTKLVIARFDSAKNVWVPLISTPDPANNKVTCATNHFSTFEIMQLNPFGNLDQVLVFPNPVRPSRGQKLTFSKLPASAAIQIFTYAGELVRNMTTDASGLAQWDARNNYGEDVASGVYVVLLKGSGGKRKILVGVER